MAGLVEISKLRKKTKKFVAQRPSPFEPCPQVGKVRDNVSSNVFKLFSFLFLQEIYASKKERDSTGFSLIHLPLEEQLKREKGLRN